MKTIEEMAHDYAVAMLGVPSSLTGLGDKDEIKQVVSALRSVFKGGCHESD